MVDAVVDVVGAVAALEARGARARVRSVQVHTRGAVLTRVEALTAKLYLLLAILAWEYTKRRCCQH